LNVDCFGSGIRLPNSIDDSLLIKQSFEITASLKDVKNQDVASLDSMNDDVRSDWKTSQTVTQVVIAAATHVRMFG
jgi:hypothetical protein